MLAWGILNFFFIALLRRPALSGALSLTLVVVLVLLSRLKHDVVQMTANFVDLMVIDRDTAAFLFTIFPNLRWSVMLAALVILPLMYALWWLDPFRIRRLPALAGKLACLAALVGYSMTWPDEAWRGYYDDGYFSKFARSGVTAVSDFVNYGFMESDAVLAERLKMPLVDSCHVAGRRPHIIMIHDESSFGHPSGRWRQGAGGLWQPLPVVRRQGAQVPGRKQRRRKLDGRIQCAGRAVVALVRPLLLFRHPHRVGPGRARIAAGAAPLRLQHHLALSGLWRLHGRARLPDHHRASSTSMTRAISAPRASSPTASSTTRLLKLIAEQPANTPLFTFVYLAANHFPWETKFRPDLLPSWRSPGNAPVVDEYLRRQAISAGDYAGFIADPEEEVPGAAVPDRALWRSPAGVLVEPARSRPR